MILVFRKNTKNPANFRFHPNLQDFFYFLSLITFYLSFAVVVAFFAFPPNVAGISIS